MKTKKAGIKEIAEMAGVSIGTVDRVLHKRPGVSTKTRSLILKLIEQSDYVPNQVARSLATGRKYRIISLLPGASSPEAYWSMPPEGIKLAQEELSAYGVRFENYIFKIDDPDDFDRVAAKALDSNPDGILLAPVHSGRSIKFIEKCAVKNIKVVLIDSNTGTESCATCIGQDPYRSGQVAARLMIQSLKPGSKILIVNTVWGKEHSSHVKHREQGFRSWINESPPGKSYMLKSINIPDNVSSDSVVDLPPDYNAIFATSNPSRLTRIIEPETLRKCFFVSYDLTGPNIELLEKNIINILIGQRPEYQGYTGINTLFNLLVNKEEKIINHFIPIDIIIKENYKDYLNHQPRLESLKQ